MLIFSIILLAILFDQLSKRYISRKLPEGSYRELLRDRLFLTNVKNRGAAGGLFSDRPRLLIGGTILSLGWALWMLFKTYRQKGGQWEKISLAFLLGGAAGNSLDRFRKRPVTDFIYIKSPKMQNLPVFNLADASIALGALLYLAAELCRPRRGGVKGGY